MVKGVTPKGDLLTRGAILGARIRQRRREIGVTQSELARRIGISASYLNLIEWNKRRIAGSLLRKTADALALPLDELDGSSERRLAETLIEVAHLPSLSALGIEGERIGELIGRFPGWARGAAALARSERAAVAHAQVLSERLSNDPYLGETVHRMLTRIAAVRSAVEILTDYSDIPEDQRDRFTQIIHEESGVLSEVGEALAAYLDKAEDMDRVMTPLDEVEAVFELRSNRFEEIEAGAAGLSDSVTEVQPSLRRNQAAGLVGDRLGRTIEAVIQAESRLVTAAGKARARRALADYAVGAVLMPMDALAERSAALRYDIEALADSFGTEIEAVCQRLTALTGEGVPQFGYLRANAAGTIIEMVGLRGLAVPRYANACPLWVLYRAQQSPEAVIRQRALFPSGARYVFVARARHTGPIGFGRPRHYLTDMLVMEEGDAAETVYAPDPSTFVEEVGPSCRLCPRRACGHRVEDPLSA